VLLDAIRDRYGSQPLTIISPDAGGVERARAYAKRLNASLAIIDKRREAANVSQVMNIIGDVSGPHLRDRRRHRRHRGHAHRGRDRAQGRRRRGGVGRDHASVLSGPAIKRIRESSLTELVITDTVPLRPEAGRLRADPRGQHLASAVRGDPPHQQRRERELSVRLERSFRAV
jgi:ribose-phosphate pyrophosphokinase